MQLIDHGLHKRGGQTIRYGTHFREISILIYIHNILSSRGPQVCCRLRRLFKPFWADPVIIAFNRLGRYHETTFFIAAHEPGLHVQIGRRGDRGTSSVSCVPRGVKAGEVYDQINADNVRINGACKLGRLGSADLAVDDSVFPDGTHFHHLISKLILVGFRSLICIPERRAFFVVFLFLQSLSSRHLRRSRSRTPALLFFLLLCFRWQGSQEGGLPAESETQFS